LARAGVVLELFATSEAIERNSGLLSGREVSPISAKSAAALSGTVNPQGLVAVCRIDEPSLATVLASGPRLLAVLVEPNEPGNLGAIIRTADAAGADAVVIAGGADPYNGKAVRASAGSLFHLPVLGAEIDEVLAGAGRAGLTTLAATGHGRTDLDSLINDGTLAGPSAWLFGSEAHGLPASVLEAVDHTVRVPMYGRAESLNLAVAAGVCLFASARQLRGT
jgi:TrmH family RNA methyltransferase